MENPSQLHYSLGMGAMKLHQTLKADVGTDLEEDRILAFEHSNGLKNRGGPSYHHMSQDAMMKRQ